MFRPKQNTSKVKHAVKPIALKLCIKSQHIGSARGTDLISLLILYFCCSCLPFEHTKLLLSIHQFLIHITLIVVQSVCNYTVKDIFALTSTNLLLDELVPVLVWERSGADDQFVPMSSDVIITRLLRDPHSIKLQTTSNLLLTLEYHQRNLQWNIMNE